MIFIGSMVMDQVMRYMLPIENAGDGKAALQKAVALENENTESNIIN